MGSIERRREGGFQNATMSAKKKTLTACFTEQLELTKFF